MLCKAFIWGPMLIIEMANDFYEETQLNELYVFLEAWFWQFKWRKVIKWLHIGKETSNPANHKALWKLAGTFPEGTVYHWVVLYFCWNWSILATSPNSTLKCDTSFNLDKEEFYCSSMYKCFKNIWKLYYLVPVHMPYFFFIQFKSIHGWGNFWVYSVIFLSFTERLFESDRITEG